MSPEYALNGVVSTKMDVFSFGVLLLEILCGIKNNCSHDPDFSLNLIGYVSFLNNWCVKFKLDFNRRVYDNAGFLTGLEVME